MNVNVRVRLNKVTGEIELFDVIDLKTEILPEAEHNRLHDRIAADLGGVVARSPQVIEVFPGPGDSSEPGEVTTTGAHEEVREAAPARQREEKAQ